MNKIVRGMAMTLIVAQLLLPFIYSFIGAEVKGHSDEAADMWFLEGIVMAAYNAPIVVAAILFYVFSGSFKASGQRSKELAMLALGIATSIFGTAAFVVWWSLG